VVGSVKSWVFSICKGKFFSSLQRLAFYWRHVVKLDWKTFYNQSFVNSYRKNNRMKKLLTIAIICCSFTLVLLSCKKDKNIVPDEPDAVRLYNCSEKNRKVEPYICFDSLITDSRCPKDAVCIWAGYAMIKVSFHENNNTHVFNMVSPFVNPVFGGVNDTIINGYRIVFAGLSPYPSATLPYPDNDEIKATINITH
jgi:hypothetical protein